ncbi:MAG: HAD family hydrolase [Firmicutes bacterium]|nr:HAD family hydrolase [Bacillota bacterium]
MQKHILFDLDGTLLPMDLETFTRGYFGLLAKKLAPRGYEPSELVSAVLAGTEAMVKNDGSCTNEDAFWRVFAGRLGEHVYADKPAFEEFYRVEFQQARAFCGCNPEAAQTVRALQARGYSVALATNPIFPATATHSRIRWAGLAPEDFEWITTYENIGFCKPNPAYYTQVLRHLGAAPEDCLMVGNDVTEDGAAEQAGIRVFLLTDCLINSQGADISARPHGSFRQLMEYVDTLWK